VAVTPRRYVRRMGRPPRVEYAGAYSHIMNRGGGRRDIFVDDRDRRRFLQFVGQAHERFGFEVHAFCLMGNHFHILARAPRANVGEALHHITSCYASWSNHRRGTDGSLFRGRYLAKHVDEDNYLLHVSRYVHLNPVKANLVRSADAYSWSSMAAYLGRMPRPTWLRTGQILNMIGGSNPRARYADFVGHGEGEKNPDWYRDGTCEDPTTSTDGVDEILQVIDQLVAKRFRVSTDSLRHGVRGQKNTPRAVAASISREFTDVQLRHLGNRYGFGGATSVESAISRLRNSTAHDQALANAIDLVTAEVTRVAELLVPGTIGSATGGAGGD